MQLHFFLRCNSIGLTSQLLISRMGGELLGTRHRYFRLTNESVLDPGSRGAEKARCYSVCHIQEPESYPLLDILSIKPVPIGVLCTQ